MLLFCFVVVIVHAWIFCLCFSQKQGNVVLLNWKAHAKIQALLKEKKFHLKKSLTCTSLLHQAIRLSKPRSVFSAEAEGWGSYEVLIIHDITLKPNSIIVLLYIFHIIHPRKQKQSVQPFCFWGQHSKGLSNQANFELDMTNAISAADIAFNYHVKFTSYCELIECSRPMRYFIVSVMYNNRLYRIESTCKARSCVNVEIV